MQVRIHMNKIFRAIRAQIYKKLFPPRPTPLKNILYPRLLPGIIFKGK